MTHPSLYPDLFPETLLVDIEDERIYTTSLTVAQFFKRNHRDVLKAINRLLADSPDRGFNERNFALVKYRDSKNESRPMYQLSHDGFALLAMGFTGKDALAWKIKFLEAFRGMERQIMAQREREANALFHLRPRWLPILRHPDLPRVDLIGLTGHKSPGSITACKRRMREAGLLAN